ncbi:MAG: hypothetical protein Q8Q29_05805 [Actinomycetota bacterium]|nr:hypothetical protein [Actinomycetota bacterium]
MSPSILIATADGLLLDGSPVAFEGRDVTSLALDGDGWLAVVDRSEIHSVTSGWSTKLLGRTDGVDSVAAFGGVATVGTESARIFTIGPAGIQADNRFDNAPDRDDWYTPWGGPPTVRSLDEGPDGTRWVNVHVGGVLVDDGSGWRQTMDVDNDVHQVIAHPTRPGAALAAAAVGVGWSTDLGVTWDWSKDGLHAHYARAVAVGGELVFVSVSRGPNGRDAGVYRGRLGEPFEPCDGIGRFHENIDTGWIASGPGLVAVVGPTGVVFASSDGGNAWEEAFRVDRPRALAVIVRTGHS